MPTRDYHMTLQVTVNRDTSIADDYARIFTLNPLDLYRILAGEVADQGEFFIQLERADGAGSPTWVETRTQYQRTQPLV